MSDLEGRSISRNEPLGMPLVIPLGSFHRLPGTVFGFALDFNLELVPVLKHIADSRLDFRSRGQ